MHVRVCVCLSVCLKAAAHKALASLELAEKPGDDAGRQSPVEAPALGSDPAAGSSAATLRNLLHIFISSNYSLCSWLKDSVVPSF